MYVCWQSLVIADSNGNSSKQLILSALFNDVVVFSCNLGGQLSHACIFSLQADKIIVTILSHIQFNCRLESNIKVLQLNEFVFLSLSLSIYWIFFLCAVCKAIGTRDNRQKCIHFLLTNVYNQPVGASDQTQLYDRHDY